jgi:undecaprenyl-diphosphatase
MGRIRGPPYSVDSVCSVANNRSVAFPSVVGRAWARMTRLERHEITWLLVGLGSCVLLLVFLKLASEVTAGDTLAMDTKIVRALRKADDPSKPIGPLWMAGVLEDLTALGGPTVIWLVIVSLTGYLLLQTKYHTALFVFVTAASGDLINHAIKGVFSRARPTVVPHLREAFSTSFPSGHAMESAIVYLTLAAMLMRIVQGRVTKAYCLGLAVLITFLVGVSRVYLGVHYPTDVLGGWIIGMAWASVCWLAARHYEVRAGLRADRRHSA